jgi:nucleoside-diphosphate-sugar epimerase
LLTCLRTILLSEFAPHPISKQMEPSKNAAEILVIGALGNVGAEVVKCLRPKGVAVRAADLFPDKLKQHFGDEVEAVPFDFGEPSKFVC